MDKSQAKQILINVIRQMKLTKQEYDTLEAAIEVLSKESTPKKDD